MPLDLILCFLCNTFYVFLDVCSGFLALGQDWQSYCKALEFYLQQVATHPNLCKCKALDGFLINSEVQTNTYTKWLWFFIEFCISAWYMIDNTILIETRLTYWGLQLKLKVVVLFWNMVVGQVSFRCLTSYTISWWRPGEAGRPYWNKSATKKVWPA